MIMGAAASSELSNDYHILICGLDDSVRTAMMENALAPYQQKEKTNGIQLGIINRFKSSFYFYDLVKGQKKDIKELPQFDALVFFADSHAPGLVLEARAKLMRNLTQPHLEECAVMVVATNPDQCTGISLLGVNDNTKFTELMDTFQNPVHNGENGKLFSLVGMTNELMELCIAKKKDHKTDNTPAQPPLQLRQLAYDEFEDINLSSEDEPDEVEIYQPVGFLLDQLLDENMNIAFPRVEDVDDAVSLGADFFDSLSEVSSRLRGWTI